MTALKFFITFFEVSSKDALKKHVLVFWKDQQNFRKDALNEVQFFGSKREKLKIVKGCVRYIFASLFCKSKGEHLSN